MERITDEIKEVLEGGVDLHLHTAPDIFPRRLDDFEAAEQAKEAGLKAVVLKNHFFPTSSRAKLASERTGFTLIGSITLNKPVGGINPYAVEMALKEGARVVWMPTIHSINTLRRPELVTMFQKIMRSGEEGLAITEGDGLIPDVYQVLEIVRDSDAVLATGHISPQEVIPLVKAAVEMGLKRVILTHPFSHLVGMGKADVKGLLDLSPGIYVEFTCYDCSSHIKEPLSYEEVKGLIREVSPGRTVISSDGGQRGNPPPYEMLAEMVGKLLPSFGREGIRRMVVENPSFLMDL